MGERFSIGWQMRDALKRQLTLVILSSLTFLTGVAAPSSWAAEDRPGQMIPMNTIYGTTFYSYVVGPEDAKQSLVLVHDRWGLDKFALDTADSLGRLGFYVVMPDLFEGRSAQKRIEREGLRLLSQADPASTVENLRGALMYINTSANRRAAVLGWGYGAGQALKITVAEPVLVISTVMIAGGPLITSEQKLREIRGPVLGIFSNDDPFVSTTQVDRFADAMNQNRNSVVMVRVEARTGFLEPDLPEYDPTTAQRSWQRAVDFLHETLGVFDEPVPPEEGIIDPAAAPEASPAAEPLPIDSLGAPPPT